MGYWAKDGAYVHDDDDIRSAEAMNESQGQAFDRFQRATAQAEAYEAEQKRKAEAEKDFQAQVNYERWVYENEQAKKNFSAMEEARKQQRKQENLDRYGVSYDLRNPKDLSERRSRANFWRLNNDFRLFFDIVIGKDKRFGNLWDRYEKAQTDEERLEIVEKMEKLYPTRESAVQSVERKTGYRK